jgi:diguanylate cyclase (GGDEF)-like protein
MPSYKHHLFKLPVTLTTISKPVSVAVADFAACFLGIIDYTTGPQLSFSIFYLIPISYVVFFNGRRAGIFISLVCATVWMTADLAAGAHYSSSLIPYWNAAVRLGYFCLHTYLLSYLRGMIETMRELAFYDPLTGAPNWRLFKETAQKEMAIMRRLKKPITVAYVDLDNFKSINDTFGHDAGDTLLKVAVETIQKNIRSSDLFTRAGGDEFVLFLPDTDIKYSFSVLSRIRDIFSGEMTKRNYPVTMSMGAITFRTIPSTIEEMIKKTDSLMYTVKKEGKNDIRHMVWPHHETKIGLPEITVKKALLNLSLR